MKQLKRTLTFAFVILDIILLTGGYSVHGRLYQWIGHPIVNALTVIANALGGPNAIGWGIIIITAIMRLIILPLFVNQQRNGTISQLKMRMLKPEIDKIQARAKAAQTPAEQQAASMATMTLYRENNVSLTGGISFLTMAMQLPIFSGLYVAVLHVHGLQTATFMGFGLGKPQVVFAAIAGIIYLIQAWIAMLRMPADQRKTTGAVMFLSPVSIIFVSMISSGAVGLYFIVTSLFALIQTVLIHFQYPSLEKKVDDEFSIQARADDILSRAYSDSEVKPGSLSPRDVTPKPKGNRNAGKQNRS
ncbi:membrane protein insertase YidC [Lactobacillaceae bacterium L1_55_11]|nr:membrane protein insertase YidC [Lactobacillaceae bacterium L1_55_11]